jgi:hypothetical protein
VAWPFSLYALNTNTNDAFVGALALLALLLAGRPAARGAAAALGSLAKFGSLGLVPLLAFHGAVRGNRIVTLLQFGAAFLVTAAVVSLPLVFHGESLSTIYDSTIGYQASRPAPFSIWGLYGLSTLQHVWQAITVVLLLGVGLIPRRRRDLVGLAALCAAVLIALQLGLTYWFYLYLVWFFPLAIIAIFGCFRIPAESRRI